MKFVALLALFFALPVQASADDDIKVMVQLERCDNVEMSHGKPVGTLVKVADENTKVRGKKVLQVTQKSLPDDMEQTEVKYEGNADNLYASLTVDEDSTGIAVAGVACDSRKDIGKMRLVIMAYEP